MTKPGKVRVSVILCVHNGADTIRRQLDALDAQVDHPSFEIIVVNNQSTDTTAEVVDNWLAERAPSDVDARLIGAPDRASLPYARNQGALAASGEIFAYCDADDEADPRWVGALARCLTADGLLGGRVEAYQPNGDPAFGTFPDGLIWTPYLPHVGGANHAMTRECFFAVGGYDESLPSYGYDDVDVSWRVQEQGLPILYCSDAVMRFTLSTPASAVRKKYLLSKGRVLMAKRHPGAFTPFTLSGCVQTLVNRSVWLPYRMWRPGPYSRTRHISWVITAWGNLVGYWEFEIRNGRPNAVLVTDPAKPQDYLGSDQSS